MGLRWVWTRCIVAWVVVHVLGCAAEDTPAVWRLATFFKPSFGYATAVVPWRNGKIRGRAARMIYWNLGSLGALPWNVSSVTEPSEPHVCVRLLNTQKGSTAVSLVPQLQWYTPVPLGSAGPLLDVVPDVVLEFYTVHNKSQRARMVFPSLARLLDSDAWYCTSASPCSVWDALVRDRKLETLSVDDSRGQVNLTSTHVKLVFAAPHNATWKAAELAFFLGHNVHAGQPFGPAKELVRKDADGGHDVAARNEAARRAFLARVKDQAVQDTLYASKVVNTLSVDSLLRDVKEDASAAAPCQTASLLTSISDAWQRLWLRGLPFLSGFPFTMHSADCPTASCAMLGANTMNFYENVSRHSVLLDIATNRPYCDETGTRPGEALLLTTNHTGLNPLRAVIFMANGQGFTGRNVQFARMDVPSIITSRTAFASDLSDDSVDSSPVADTDRAQPQLQSQHPATSRATRATPNTTAGRPTTMAGTLGGTAQGLQTFGEATTLTTANKAPLNTWLILTSAGALTCGIGAAAIYALWHFFWRKPAISDKAFALDLEKSNV